MKIHSNFSLKTFNTFGVEAFCSQFGYIEKESQLSTLLEQSSNGNVLVLGSGSNVLFTSDFHGLVLKMDIQGIQIIDQNDDFVWVKAGGGVEWEKMVDFAVENNFSGLENLTQIPGLVGTAPVQNIGAYGVEFSDVCDSVEIFDVYKGMFFEIKKQDCHFGYRNSIFKQQTDKRFIITSVVFKLNRRFEPIITYDGLRNLVSGVHDLNIKIIREAVASLRKGKLPHQSEVGSAGSFFKNPEISPDEFEKLNTGFSEIPAWPTATGYKISAAWLIEYCGWKGYREGDAGVWPNQALVLVNYGNASGTNIFDLAKKIRNSVFDTFGIQLTPEVNIIGNKR